jgi:hypothetical protein
MGRGETGQPIKLRMDCNKFYSMSTAGNGKRVYGIYLVQQTGKMLQVGIFCSSYSKTANARSVYCDSRQGWSNNIQVWVKPRL